MSGTCFTEVRNISNKVVYISICLSLNEAVLNAFYVKREKVDNFFELNLVNFEKSSDSFELIFVNHIKSNFLPGTPFREVKAHS